MLALLVPGLLMGGDAAAEWNPSSDTETSGRTRIAITATGETRIALTAAGRTRIALTAEGETT